MGLFDVGKTFKPLHVAGVKESRFIEPHGYQDIPDYKVKYSNAEKLATDIGTLPIGFRAFCILDGKFIFGDFIEALIVKNNWDVEDLTISTLSMSQENVDSLKNLLTGGFVRSLNMLVSHYYFATERHKGGLIPYIYEQLDTGDAFQLGVASVHTKICMIRTACGKKVTIHGSANLRTSSNIEQIVVEHTPDLYDFSHGTHSAIIEKYRTINKPVRRNNCWWAILQTEQENTWPPMEVMEAVPASQSTIKKSNKPLQSAKQAPHPSANQNASKAAHEVATIQTSRFKAGA